MLDPWVESERMGPSSRHTGEVQSARSVFKPISDIANHDPIWKNSHCTYTLSEVTTKSSGGWITKLPGENGNGKLQVFIGCLPDTDGGRQK